jgi:uncharacterized protein (TIGR03083 family)
MEIAAHIAAVDREGRMLADAAERAGLRAAVPSCPPWRVSDLLRHQGYVHRWAARYVAEQIREPVPGESEEAILRGGPADAALIGWFRDGHAGLVAALRTAAPDVASWTFLDAPSPLAFWARRQAHETAIHRADAQLAAGEVADYEPEFAADGVDELILSFFGRDVVRQQRAGAAGTGTAVTSTAGPAPAPERTLRLRAADTGGEWFAEMSADGGQATRVGRGTSPAACSLTGPAAGLYLLLWNRADAAVARVTVGGDDQVLALWRAGMAITWG